jgi:hypothetical protein
VKICEYEQFELKGSQTVWKAGGIDAKQTSPIKYSTIVEAVPRKDYCSQVIQSINPPNRGSLSGIHWKESTPILSIPFHSILIHCFLSVIFLYKLPKKPSILLMDYASIFV